MDKKQAQEIIRNTFENPFDQDRFTEFVKNLLNNMEEAPFTYQGNYIPDAYKQYIKKLERIGKFTDGENNIDILVITLQKETSLERARTMQRNFIAKYLNGSRGNVMKDAALAAFVSPDDADWRFSLVKMDYKFEQTKSGKMKVKEDFTPARRWSFLVGANEKSHTAQSRLVGILANDQQNPTLEEIEKAFDIETVTREFFLKYRELFIRTKEELDKVVKKDTGIKTDFTNKGVDTVNFAKKLLGQIVFLYFLQKKGWFGVGRDDDWGSGSKHFLRELFEKKHGGYKNFFNDILEPLFYEALRIDRSHDDDYYSRFNCKIPFLNGGLFDPIGGDGGYNWVHTDILLPDALFSNTAKTPEGDIGDGILDIFDRYNFTVKEDEPLEKEVAIDPELLGKAYEKFNAIRPDNYEEYKKVLKSGKKGDETRFNKQFGVYYTPREIVHYMCQQSLINYLYSELNEGPVSYEKFGDPQLNMLGNKGKKGQLDLIIEHKSTPSISKEDIEVLIHMGEHVSENEARVISEGRETKTYYHKLPESIRNYAALIDKKLEEITVCDPAVGSGAFPVGMMSEIVRARNVLSPFIKVNARTPYEFKRRCIEHSLYGVDIDPGAVEIAKLRLWLSLIVDEDDIIKIKPLPNLDYRIMQGDSLISEFMGINFDVGKVEPNVNLMFKSETDLLIEQFEHKKNEFLNESNVTRKSRLKDDINDLLIEIYETKLETQKADYFNRINNIEKKYSALPDKKQRDDCIKQDKEKLYKETGLDLESAEKQLKDFTSGRQIKPFFLWNLYFSEVFYNKGGFDVVIANPPYGANIDDYTKLFEILYPKTSKGFKDIYKYFFNCSLEKLVKDNGFLSFITPNTYFLQPRYGDLRRYLLEFMIISLINLGEDVFEAVVPTAISLIQCTKVQSSHVISFADISDFSKYPGSMGNIIFNSINQEAYLSTPSNIFVDNYRSKKNDEEHLGSILEFKDAGVNYQRVNVGLADKRNSDLSLRLLYEGKKQNKTDVEYWKGVDIDSYYTSPRTNRFVRTNIKLHSNERVILNKEYFTIHPKLIWRQTASYPIATIDTKGIWFGRSIQAGIINNYWQHKIDYKYLLALLNSAYIRYLYILNVKESGRVFPQVKLEKLKFLPVKVIALPKQRTLIELVDKILSITKAEDYKNNKSKQAIVKELEKQIDQKVYKLYGLTDAEIAIVENSVK